LNQFKVTGIVFLIILCISGVAFAKDESIISLSDHELGDQTISINAGAMLPLPFLKSDGTTYPSNQIMGGAGAFQWNAYLNKFLRIGLELGISFTFSPDITAYGLDIWKMGDYVTTFLMVPFTAKLTYVLNYSRFEFPLSLGIGANIVKFGSEKWNIAMIVKPGLAAYYRYDSNLSFGLNLAWWCNFEFPTPNEPNTIMANSLEISPALFYHF